MSVFILMTWDSVCVTSAKLAPADGSQVVHIFHA